MIIFLGKLTTLRGAYQKQKNHEQVKYALVIDTAVEPIPIDEIPINMWFLSTKQCLSDSIWALQYHRHGLV